MDLLWIVGLPPGGEVDVVERAALLSGAIAAAGSEVVDAEVDDGVARLEVRSRHLTASVACDAGSTVLIGVHRGQLAGAGGPPAAALAALVALVDATAAAAGCDVALAVGPDDDPALLTAEADEAAMASVALLWRSHGHLAAHGPGPLEAEAERRFELPGGRLLLRSADELG